MVARIKAASIKRPLAILAAKEAELHAHSAGLAKLSGLDAGLPDQDLLVDQLMRTVSSNRGNSHHDRKIRRQAVALYSALGSRDPIESMIDRVLVGMNIATMDCLEELR